MSDGKLALVLSGGGSKGALQAGLYLALDELGVRPDFVVGASVGALNGAFVAAGRDAGEVAEGWAETERSDLFAPDWSMLWRGLSRPSLFRGGHFRRFLEGSLPVHRFEELDLPLHVISTHLSLGQACVLNEGDLVQAVGASTAVPGLLPPVELHGGVLHVDGSLGDNLPIAVAFERGADRVIALNSRTCARCEPGSVNVVQALGRAFGIAADCSLRLTRARYEDDPDVLLLQPDLGERIQALDFAQCGRLVEEGYDYSLPEVERWLSRR